MNKKIIKLYKIIDSIQKEFYTTTYLSKQNERKGDLIEK